MSREQTKLEHCYWGGGGAGETDLAVALSFNFQPLVKPADRNAQIYQLSRGSYCLSQNCSFCISQLQLSLSLVHHD